MPSDRKQAPEGQPGREAPEAPRTDLPPEREPYYEGYFGTDEEEGVVREEERKEDAPRTDLPPAREPYDEGYFGTGEEEGVERERQAPEGGDGRGERKDR